MNSCTYCGRLIDYSAHAAGLAPASDDATYHQACADHVDGKPETTNRRGWFSYTGTVAGLELVMEDQRYFSRFYSLSEKAHKLAALLREFNPTLTPADIEHLHD